MFEQLIHSWYSLPADMQVGLSGLLVGLIALMALSVWAHRRDSKIAKERRSSVILRRSFAKHNLMPSRDAVRAESTDSRGQSLAVRVEEAPTPRLLAPPAKPFVGQFKVLMTLRRLLARRHTQLITLVSEEGQRGVGLSALAAHIYYSDGDKFFPDGKFWLDLCDGNLALALRRLLYVLEVDGTTMPNDCRRLSKLLHQQLAGKRVLLVLDDVHALAPNNAQKVQEFIELILLPAPSVTMITSHLPLYPNKDLVVAPFCEEEALLFLRQKLAWKQAHASAEEQDAKRLINITGGLPYALELTTLWMMQNQSSASGMSACCTILEDWYPKLARYAQDDLRFTMLNDCDRHYAQPLALIYHALPQPIKKVFHAIGLCAPTGTPFAALADMLEATPSDVHSWLVSHDSLFFYDHEQKHVQLSMRVLYQYAAFLAQTQLQEATVMITRHSRYFGLLLGGSYQRAIEQGKDVAQALAVIAHEEANVRLAQERALTHGFPAPELAIDITLALWLYWRLREETALVGWLTRAQRLAKERGLPQACQIQKAIGDVYAASDKHDAAALAYKLAFALYQQSGNLQGQAKTVKAIGDLEAAREKEDTAFSFYQQALTLFQQAGDYEGQADVKLALERLTGPAL